jgi:hypothetical protein
MILLTVRIQDEVEMEPVAAKLAPRARRRLSTIKRRTIG